MKLNHMQKLEKAKQLGIKLSENSLPERTSMIEKIKIRLECLRAITSNRNHRTRER